MKVQVGNKTMSLPKETVASHMANLITTRLIMLGKIKDFRSSFLKHKELCMIFLRMNKKFVYSFGSDDWLEDFFKFQTKHHELLMQEIFFRFSDGSEWSISLNDLANLKIMHESNLKHDKTQLLEKPLELSDWAQSELTWDQIKDFAILRRIDDNSVQYNEEWPSVNKKVVQFSYDIE
jgi:hypothetical protein